MKYIIFTLLGLMAYGTTPGQSITLYNDKTYEQSGSFHIYENNRFNVYLSENKQSTDLYVLNNDRDYIIKCNNCSIEKDVSGWLILYTTKELVNIEITDIKNNFTYKLSLKTTLPDISINGGYIPPKGHHKQAYLTPDITINNNTGRDNFNIVSCTILVADSSDKTTFTEHINGNKITQWDAFKKSITYGSQVFYEDIIIKNNKGDIIKYDVKFVVSVF